MLDLRKQQAWLNFHQGVKLLFELFNTGLLHFDDGIVRLYLLRAAVWRRILANVSFPPPAVRAWLQSVAPHFALNARNAAQRL